MARARVFSCIEWGTATLLLLLGCRSHIALCESETCTAAASSAAGAGAGESSGGEPGRGGAPSAGAHSGGNAGEPDCQRDPDCDNEWVCDGAERCVVGRCESGEPVECRYGTECTEATVSPCVYAEASPWLVAVGPTRVEGLPLAQIAAGGTLSPIAEREVVPGITGYEQLFWAPNGKVALLRAVEDQLGFSMKLIRFGRGLPSPPVFLPDVPTWGSFWDAPEFSDDARQALIYDAFTGGYVVDLDEEPAPTELHTGDSGFSTPIEARCSEPDTWLQADADGVHYKATLDGAGVSLRELGPGALTVSDDARWVTRTFEPDDDDAGPGGVWLYECARSASALHYEDAVSADFAPGSARLALELRGGGARALSLADSGEPELIWESPAGSSPRFTPDGDKLVLTLPGSAGAQSLHYVDLTSEGRPEPRAVELPAEASLAWLGNTSLLVWAAESAAGPPQLWWQGLDSQGGAVLLAGDVSFETTKLRALPFAPRYVLVQSTSPEGTTLSTLEFDGKLSELTPLATFSNPVAGVIPWTEGRGLVVTTTDGGYDQDAWWLSFATEERSVELRKLFDDLVHLSVQPWP